MTLGKPKATSLTAYVEKAGGGGHVGKLTRGGPCTVLGWEQGSPSCHSRQVPTRSSGSDLGRVAASLHLAEHGSFKAPSSDDPSTGAASNPPALPIMHIPAPRDAIKIKHIFNTYIAIFSI